MSSSEGETTDRVPSPTAHHTCVYKVWLRWSPDKTVALEFDEPQTVMEVRDRACSEGHFSWRDYIEIRLRRVV